MTDTQSPPETRGTRPGALIAVIALHRLAADIADDLNRLADQHPGIDLAVGTGMSGHLEVRLAGTPCGCHTCVAEDQQVRIDSGQYPSWSAMTIGMIVCPECGNKRCPRATSHDLACTDSNDVGQPGSRYA